MEMRLEKQPAFTVTGRTVWISGQNNEEFGVFWLQAHADGLVDRLRALCGDVHSTVTQSAVFGVSRVEADPNNRAFFFYIVTEAPSAAGLETFTIPACEWAIFTERGELPMSLVNAEMDAFMRWLPASGYQHAHAPELEVYPFDDGNRVEFWLPIEPKKA